MPEYWRHVHSLHVRDKLKDMIPKFVLQHCRDEYKEKDKLRVDVNVYEDEQLTKFLYKHGLDFSWDLNFHGLNGFALPIDEYIERVIKYNRKPVTICINGVRLDDIKPKNPAPIHPPQEIDLSSTSINNDPDF